MKNPKFKEGTLLKQNYFFSKKFLKCFLSFCWKSKMQRGDSSQKKINIVFIVSFKCFWSLRWKFQMQRGDSFQKKILFFFKVSLKCFQSLCWKSQMQRGDSSIKNIIFSKFLLSAFAVYVENPKCREGRLFSKKIIFFFQSFF